MLPFSDAAERRQAGAAKICGPGESGFTPAPGIPVGANFLVIRKQIPRGLKPCRDVCSLPDRFRVLERPGCTGRTREFGAVFATVAFVALDQAVLDVDDAMGVGGDVVLVGYQDDGVAF